MWRSNVQGGLCLPVFFAAASTALFARQAADGGQLAVGTAATVITPILRSPMAGYYFDREADEIHDELMAKAILFRQSGKTVGLVVCDLIELPGAVADKAKALIAERTGILPGHLILSATHAHTGPQHRPDYDDWLVEKIADAVQLAAARLAPARLAFGVGEETRLAHHRRYWMKDETLRTNPGKMNPDVVRPAGAVDPAVPVLAVIRPDGSPLAIVVNYALHLDTIGGTAISADFPHYLASILGRALGPEMLTIHTTGACGNVNHWDIRSADPQRSFAEAERIGTMLAGEVLKVTTFAEPVAVDRIDGRIEDLELPLKSFTAEELARAREIVKTPNPPGVDFVLERVWALRALEVAGRGQPTIRTRVQAIRLGDVALVAVPCELFCELGMDIKRQSPFSRTVVVELANDNIGYVPRREDYDNGGYEVVNSRLAPGGGERIAAAAVELLRRLHGQK